MDFDAVDRGRRARPASPAAIRIKQMAAETGKDVSVVVLEKGSEIRRSRPLGRRHGPEGDGRADPRPRQEEGCPFPDAR